LSDTGTVIVKPGVAEPWHNWGSLFINEPATREDLQQTANSICEDFCQDLRRFEEKIANAIASLSERMDRRFDAIDKRFDAIDRRLESMETGIGQLQDGFDRLARQFSGFTRGAGQPDRSAQILAIQAAQQRSMAAFFGQRPPQ